MTKAQGDETTLAVSYQQLPTAVKPGILAEKVFHPEKE